MGNKNMQTLRNLFYPAVSSKFIWRMSYKAVGPLKRIVRLMLRALPRGLSVLRLYHRQENSKKLISKCRSRWCVWAPPTISIVETVTAKNLREMRKPKKDFSKSGICSDI